MTSHEVKELLRDRAEQVHFYGDFAPAAISGARKVRTRRALTAAVGAALALAIPFGLVGQGSDGDRGTPATSPGVATATTKVSGPPAVTATARSGAPTAAMPTPYVQQGLLHLGGRTIRVSDPGSSILFFGTLSNGGVVYQVAGPDENLPNFDAGPVTFLDFAGRQLREDSLTEADLDGVGEIVTGVDASGDYVALDPNGRLLRQFAAPELVAPFPTGLGELLGDHVAVNLVGVESYLFLGDIAKDRSFVLRKESGGSPYRGLAVHEGRSLVIQGKWGVNTGVDCKVLLNYRSGERLRDWCDRERAPRGFSPAGDWIFGSYESTPGVWVERTDDGAKILEIRADTAAGDELAGAVAPSPDGSALLVSVNAKDGTTVTTSCAVATGECTVVGDGTSTQDEITLPMNWGR